MNPRKEGFIKKIPEKKRKVTELYFNEYDGTAGIYTYNTKHKKRLTVYAATYPGLDNQSDTPYQKTHAFYFMK